MNIYEQKKRVEEEPDFIALKRFGYSLAKLLERYPDGCPDKIAAQALGMTEAEYKELYHKAVAKLKIIMNVRD